MLPVTCIGGGAVFGKDDRTPMPDNFPDSKTVSPWNMVGAMSPIGCTATLIAPRFVLTAAHCLVDSANNPLFQSAPGFALTQHGAGGCNTPFGIRYATRAWVPSPYGTTPTGSLADIVKWKAHDWAVLELANEIAPPATPMDLLAVPSGKGTQLIGARCYSVGYPAGSGDRPVTVGGYSEVKWVGLQQVDGYGEAGTLFLEIDATGGQSGSAVYTYAAKREAFGVLAGWPPQYPCAAILAALLTADVRNKILDILSDVPPLGMKLLEYPGTPDQAPDNTCI